MEDKKEDNQLGCARCGHCCHYIIYKNNKPVLKKCKHLVRLSNRKTVCRMYNKMLSRNTKHGHIIDTYMFGEEKKMVFCMWRKDGQFDYKDCPFNIGEIPYFEDYLLSLDINVPWKK